MFPSTPLVKLGTKHFHTVEHFLKRLVALLVMIMMLLVMIMMLLLKIMVTNTLVSSPEYKVHLTQYEQKLTSNWIS